MSTQNEGIVIQFMIFLAQLFSEKTGDIAIGLGVIIDVLHKL